MEPDRNSSKEETFRYYTELALKVGLFEWRKLLLRSVLDLVREEFKQV